MSFQIQFLKQIKKKKQKQNLLHILFGYHSKFTQSLNSYDQKAFKYNFKFPPKDTNRLREEPIGCIGDKRKRTSTTSTPTLFHF